METLTQGNDETPELPGGTKGRCVELRMQGKGVRAIARELGISAPVVHRHLAHPDARRVLDAVGRAAVIAARDEVAKGAPEVARKARRVALGLETASPQQVAAMKLILSLSGMEQPVKLEVTGALDIRHTGDDALRARLAALRAGDDDGAADEG